ncbi:MAG: amidohydrolase family protein [Spirochaetes bacterium]|nr:amidohydrolase family protein [Spirochaetota bacterium]
MLIRNGLLALPGEDSLVRADLRTRDERISGISLAAGGSLAPADGEVVVDASKFLVFPGALDPHVHFDEPGFESREDFFHGSSEAAKGGVTTVIDMPCTSLPPVTNREALHGKLEAMGGKSVVDFALYGGVAGNGIGESLAHAMADLAPDVVGFKCYFISSMETFTRIDHYRFPEVLRKAAGLGRPLLLHAEDWDLVTAATAAVKSARGNSPPEWADYVASRPEAAETVACAAAVALASGFEPNLHVVHVGTAEAARIVASAGASCETCAHYLAFSSDDFASKGSSLKTAPVVKEKGQSELLWKHLADGSIAFCASDHAPSPFEEKNTGSVWTDYGGIPGTGTMAPYLLSEGLFAGRLTLRRYVEISSESAAKRYGLWGGKGSLEPGKDADFFLVDPEGSWTVEGRSLLSKGRITPFEGMRLRGRVISTWVRGRPVYEAARADRGETGIAVEAGYGKHLRWGYR